MFRMPKTSKTSLANDSQAYVETNSETKMFRAVLEKVDYVDAPDNIEHVTINHDKNTRIVSLELVVSTDSSIANEQFKSFATLLSKLNDASNLNNFYLSRTDFFNRQCKRFIEQVVGESLDSSKSKNTNTHFDHGHSGNFAF